MVCVMVNVSNYGKLIESGVRIFEYKPGFIHAKNVVSDDECAICGTINTDYRSFYLHYECGVFLSEMGAVYDMKNDFPVRWRNARKYSLINGIKTLVSEIDSVCIKNNITYVVGEWRYLCVRK